jgi:glycosyltransferase involved in cell wall biosynthesis
MNPKPPRVTVLMPAYNAGKYIGEAIQSILDQSFQDFEILIIDDGSTDNTRDIIKSFKDLRIRIIEQQVCKGVSRSLNAGLQAAKGRYIARFDADDICFPKRLERQVHFLDTRPDYILIGTDAEYISENGDHLFNFHCRGYSYEEILEELYQYCPFIHSSVMYRKEEVLKTGGYPVNAHNFEDYLLWANLVRRGKCGNLPDPLIKVRFNPGSVTIDEKWRGEGFRKLKREIIKRGSITEKEGNKLLAIIKKQEKKRIKESAYHALCSKKFLLDNYQPGKAHWHARKAIYINPWRLDNYALFITSYFPLKWIKWIKEQSQLSSNS